MIKTMCRFDDDIEFKNKYNDLLIIERPVKKFKNYKRKKTIKVKAIRWFVNGDHPNDGPSNKEGKVVRYYKNPDIPGSSICDICGNPMYRHGWIDFDDCGRIVCPGDYVVTGYLSRETFPMAKELFEENFEEEIE